jgi:predicted amidohydrolase
MIADVDGVTLSWMKSFSKNKNAAIAGSISVKDGEGFYNRFYFVKPDGSFQFYDKKHLLF